jgi:quinol monooxygenase YgiN
MRRASAGSIVRIAEPEIDPDQIESYKALLSEEITASVRLEPGVLFLYAVSIKGRPDKIRVIEGYADEAAYEAHPRSAHFLRYKTQTADMVQSLHLFETDVITLQARADWAPKS